MMYRLPMRWGVAFEALAGLLLWLSASTLIANWAANWIVLAAVLSHSVSSYFLARGFWQLLPRRYKLPARRSLSFLVAFIWILPIFGALGVLWSITSALQHPRNRSSHNVKIVALPELPFTPPVIFSTPPYSQGALRQIVHFAERPLKRLKAVMATRHMAPREAMAIWSKATCDPVDDVRLLAYAMRDSSEKILTDHILTLTEALQDVPVRLRNARHKAIAALCWELVYHRLVQGAVKQHWLQTARHHMEVVFASSGDISPVGESTVPD
ncbi:MAG: protein PelE, partial [Nitrosospira sp.]